MKTKPTILSFALVALAACGGGASDGPKQAPTVDAPAPPPPPAAARTMGSARAMGTRPDNLFWDPTFASLGSTYAMAIYGDQVALAIDAPPTSPAGPATAVLVATATPGGSASVILFGQGGSGEFDVRVWVAAADGSALPDVSFLSTTDQEAFFGLDPVKDQDQVHGGKTYHLFQTHLPDAVFGQVMLLVQPQDDKPIAIAAPELTSSTAPSTMLLHRPARRVVPSASARRAVSRAASRPIVPIRPEVTIARDLAKLR
jgi:hypothetical protein